MLAGGGLAGIAWETGILRGIADEEPGAARELLASDVVVGTSAGSVVAAQLGSGVGLDALFERQTVASSTELRPSVDIDRITELFVTAMTAPGTMVEKRRRIGRAALATPTVAESVRRKVIAARLPSHEWPARRGREEQQGHGLRIAAVDAVSGELVAFTRDSGVSLVDAVAASCAVPGAWPPVTIGDRRYVDGGVGSIVNTELASDCQAVVVLVPAGRGALSPFGSGADDEVAAFPTPAFAVFADGGALAAFGRDPLDPACRVPSAIAGREQGRRLAGAVAEFLGR